MKAYDVAAKDFGRAFCFFLSQRMECSWGYVKGYVVQSTDDGASWSAATQLQQFSGGDGEEMDVQRTSDGRFAWVPIRFRWIGFRWLL